MNNVYLTGTFSSDYIKFGNDSIANRNSYDDIFIAKFDNNGNLNWLRSGTGSSDDYPYSISTDAIGNVYLGGTFSSPYIRFGNDSLALNGYYDIFLAKFNSSGTEQWIRVAGDTDDDEATAITTDAQGNTYVTGFIGSGATVNFGNHSITNNNYSLATFIAKYDASGTGLWAKKGQGNSYTTCVAKSINIDVNEDPYIVGYYNSDSLDFGAIKILNNSITAGNGTGGVVYTIFL